MNKNYYVSQGRTIVTNQDGITRVRNHKVDFEKLLTVENTLEKMNDYYDHTCEALENKIEAKANTITTAFGICTFITLGYFATQKMAFDSFKDFSLLESSLVPLAVYAVSAYAIRSVRKQELMLKNKLDLIRDELMRLQNERFKLNGTPTITPEFDSMPKYILEDEANRLMSNIENTVLENSFSKKLTFKKKQID